MFRLWLPKHDIVITVPPRCASQYARKVYLNNYKQLDPEGEQLFSLEDIPQADAIKLIEKSTNWIVYREHHDRLASNFYNKMVDPHGESWRSGTPYQRIYFRCATFRSFTQKVFWNISVHDYFKTQTSPQFEGQEFPLDPHIAPYKVLLSGKSPDKIFHFTEIEQLYRSIEKITGLDPQPERIFNIPHGSEKNRYLSNEETTQLLTGLLPVPDQMMERRDIDITTSTVGVCPWAVPNLELFHIDQYLEFYFTCGEKQPLPWALWSQNAWDHITEIYSLHDGDIIPGSINTKCNNLLNDELPPLKTVGDEIHTLVGPGGETLLWDWSNMKERPQKKRGDEDD